MFPTKSQHYQPGQQNRLEPKIVKIYGKPPLDVISDDGESSGLSVFEDEENESEDGSSLSFMRSIDRSVNSAMQDEGQASWTLEQQELKRQQILSK